MQRRSQLQHGYCIGVSRRSAQATAGKGLAQGPYLAARAGVEPTTLRLKVIDSSKTPPRPTQRRVTFMIFIFLKGKEKELNNYPGVELDTTTLIESLLYALINSATIHPCIGRVKKATSLIALPTRVCSLHCWYVFVYVYTVMLCLDRH